MSKEENKSKKSIFSSVSENISNAADMLEKNEKYMPGIYIVTVLLALMLANAPASAAIPIILFFFPAYFFFRSIMKTNIATALIFALPFSIAFDAIVFRIALLFTLETNIGWIAIVIGWLLLATFGYFITKKYGARSLEITNSSDGKIYLAFLVISFFSIIAYNLIFGPIVSERIFWGANDANWQTALLTYLDNGKIENPTYICAGNGEYDLDSFTSTTSILPVFMVKTLGDMTASGAQYVFLYLCFMLMVQGIFLLITSIFGLRHGIASTIFVMIPLSVFPYVGDFFGMWRLSLFNAFFPWALVFGIFWFGILGFIIRAIILTFILPIQPLSALLLIPAYLLGFSREINKERFLRYVAIAIIALIFVYFTFYQITFQTIGAGGAHYGLNIGLEGIEKLDDDLSLVPTLQISIANLGPLILAITGIVLIWLAYTTLKENSKSISEKHVLLGILAFGILVSSGIIFISDSLTQYMLKMRYTTLLVIVFPILGIMLFEFSKKQKWLVLGAGVLLLLIAMGNYEQFKKYGYFGDFEDLRLQALDWFMYNTEPNETIMFLDAHAEFSQAISNQFQMRELGFPTDIQTIEELTGDKLYQKDAKIVCSYKRYGLFDVRDEPPEIQSVQPDYIVSYTDVDPRVHEFFIREGYVLTYQYEYYLVFKKN